MSNDQTLPSQRPAAGGLQPSGSPQSPQPARQNLSQTAVPPAAVPPATVAASPRRWYRVWGRGAGLLLLLSLGLHGLLLAVPLPQTAPAEIAEDPADEDTDLEATIAITSLPPPALEEPLPVEPPAPTQAAAAPPAPAAPAPTAIAPPPQAAPAEPAPAPAAEPTPAPEATPETAAFTPSPATEPPADAAPGNILGVPLLPGSQTLASPAEGLKGDRLALHLRNGNPHPDLEGQFLVPATDKDPEAWFARVYRPVLSEAYNVRSEGAFAGAPKYSLTRDSYERFAFITVEWAADHDQMLVTVWRRNPT